MEITKKELENDILLLAMYIGKLEVVRKFIDTNVTLPELTKILVYNLFLFNFMPFNAGVSSELQTAHYNLFLYCRELDKNGFVTFK